MSDVEKLKNLVLAPYIMKATALIGVRRKVGGNQFRHVMASLIILLDYKYFNDPVLLKAAVLHDLIEDVPFTDLEDLRYIDADAPAVLSLVMEVTRQPGQSKRDYLENIRDKGSAQARLLKIADRISNLTDLHPGVFTEEKIHRYLTETEEFILPMAQALNQDMTRELTDLIKIRKKTMDNLHDEP